MTTILADHPPERADPEPAYPLLACNGHPVFDGHFELQTVEGGATVMRFQGKMDVIPVLGQITAAQVRVQLAFPALVGDFPMTVYGVQLIDGAHRYFVRLERLLPRSTGEGPFLFENRAE